MRLLDYTLPELCDFFVSIGEKPYRAKQIYKWLWAGASSFDEMTDLSLELREKLVENCLIDLLRVKEIKVSKIDGTRKYLFETLDGELIETVLMEYYYGYSICISSQAGCRMGCKFCASGMRGLARSLTAGEIASQFIMVERDVRDSESVRSRVGARDDAGGARNDAECGTCNGAEGESGIGDHVRELKHRGDSGEARIGHIVMMGVGEPFDNYEEIVKFLTMISAPEGRNLGRRQITVSTCGILSAMRRFMEDLPQANLSFSLHAPDDEIREKLMPVARSARVDELIAFAEEYTKKTGRRFSFEYALFAGVNDSDECARKLAGKLRGKGFHVNLIPGNDVPELGFKAPSICKVTRFAELLLDAGIRTTTRRSLGSDIAASCGQLRAAKNSK